MTPIRTYAMEVVALCFPIVITFVILAILGFSFFKPDAVLYECPKVQQGQSLTASTYDGKVVVCQYVQFNSAYGRAVIVKQAKEIK